MPNGSEAPGVALWLLALEDVLDDALAAACAACLDDGERARLAAFRSPRRRVEYLLGHALARVALCALAPGLAPGDWRMGEAPGGRPAVLAPPAPGDLGFNLSHTRGLLAVAVSRGCTVGVDVEWGGRAPRALALAARFFSAQETAALESLPESRRARRFLFYWTLKEAYLKARGAGLRLPLRAFTFTVPDQPAPAPAMLAPDGDITVDFRPPIADTPARWRFAAWRIADDHMVALAAAAPGTTALPLRVQHVDAAWLAGALRVPRGNATHGGKL